MLCHDLSRAAIEDVDGYPIPPLPVCIERYVEAARLTNGDVRCIGIAVSLSHLDERSYRETCALIEAQTGLQCTDPIRDGVDGLIAAMGI